jgi:multidrug efflux pump subunit AcrA (membrane-fusion protein)
VLPEQPDAPEPERAQRRSDPENSAPGRWWKLGLLAIGVVAVLAAAGAWINGAILSLETATRLTHTITRGDLVVTVTEVGTLESSKNTEIKCQIRGGYGGRGGQSTVTWVIPTGTVVQPGDELVRLDTKIIEETISLGKTDTNIAKAALARTKADVANAEIAIDGYLKGRYRSQMESLEKQLKIAKRNFLTSQTMLSKAGTLFQQGYLTEVDLEVNGYTVTQAELELKVKETEIDVLSRLTKAMELETINGQLMATKARLEGRTAGLELEQGRLDLALEEFERCVIQAPKSGLVIYPSTAKWKDTPDVTEGASVHNNQVLLLMPDLSQMQVTVQIHESIIKRIKAGLPARVTLPDRTLDTEVTSVAAVASPAGWWTGNVVRYDTIIQLPSEEGLRPGMSAEVEVVMARHEDVLSVPIAAVLETDQGYFCWVETAEGTQRRSLELGDSNDLFIVVEAGVEAGDEVVLDPLASIEEARELVGSALVHTVERGDMLVTLTEQGALESYNNTQIKCKVRGSSTINWVIESGTQVKPGDELVRLENKQIEDHLHERTKFAHLSRDAAIGFRAQATRAGIAISEYLEGRYRTDLMKLEKDLAIAEAKLSAGKNVLAHTRMMSKSGYASELDVEQNEFSVKQAEADVKIKKTEIDVLKRFTKKEELTTLEGNWEAAKAAANGHEEVLKMDEARIALAKKEIERCVIKAERAGLVIYPRGEEWKDAPDITEGATVHSDQVMLLMPDLSKMQVRFGIHESIVDRIKPGMSARVTLPDRTLDGEVSFVASTAQPAGWWTGNIVKYDAIVQLPSVEGLKPGMSAEVEIFMSRHENVLMIPLTAVLETEEGNFCWVGTAEKAQQRSLQLGDSNDTYIVVEDGLQDGDQVVLNLTAFIEEVRDSQSQEPKS